MQEHVQLSLASALVRDAFTAHMQQQQQQARRSSQPQLSVMPNRNAPQQPNIQNSGDVYGGSRPTSTTAMQTQSLNPKHANPGMPNMQQQQTFSSQQPPTWGQVCGRDSCRGFTRCASDAFAKLLFLRRSGGGPLNPCLWSRRDPFLILFHNGRVFRIRFFLPFWFSPACVFLY